MTEDTQPSCLDESINRAFARQRAVGAGILWRPTIGRRASCLGHGAGRAGRTGQWARRLGSLQSIPCPYPTMKEEPWLGSTGAEKGAEGAVGGENYAIRAMLFGDVAGYSKLSDAQLVQFARQFMTRIAAVLAEHAAGILSRRTAGDGLFLVFADLETRRPSGAALRDMVAGTRWEECGLPANLGMRISLDAGPVYAFEDPITQRDEVCGQYVNRAARIEPITPPNQVYASEAFAALHVALCRQPLRFDYVDKLSYPRALV